jgi:hypothetical protein
MRNTTCFSWGCKGSNTLGNMARQQALRRSMETALPRRIERGPYLAEVLQKKRVGTERDTRCMTRVGHCNEGSEGDPLGYKRDAHLLKV